MPCWAWLPATTAASLMMRSCREAVGKFCRLHYKHYWMEQRLGASAGFCVLWGATLTARAPPAFVGARMDLVLVPVPCPGSEGQ